MAQPKLIAVVAMASNRVIGKDGDLPWCLPSDLKWFKKLTMGMPILMGRKTMESIGRPLPGRRNVVISRSLDAAPEGFELLSTIEPVTIRKHFAGEPSVAIIGGAEIYKATISECDQVFLSYVFHPYEGDTCLVGFEDGFEMTEVLYQDDDFEVRQLDKKVS